MLPPSPAARLTYLGISAILRISTRRSAAIHVPASRLRHSRPLHTTRCLADGGTFKSSEFTTQGFTGIYDASAPTTGPLADSSAIGAPRITPRTLKDHLDQFVVGQDRAKRILATAVYNHYQRIQELQRRDAEEDEAYAQEERRRMSEIRRHPVEGREHELKRGIDVPSLTSDWRGHEDEFPGQQATVRMPPPPVSGSAPSGWRGQQQAAEDIWRPPHLRAQAQRDGSSTASKGQTPNPGAAPLVDNTPLTIEKSNILLLGPSGVGKTLMAKTLARVLEVPFSMSDCTPFTQAGYIGEDAEVCVQRLLAAANYDVAKAERGIICLDEIDKIATAKVSHGKDVSGEGVQQALLKIIEGTTLQVQAKQERSSGSGTGRQGGVYGNNSSSSSPLSGQSSGGSTGGGGGGQKGEVYNVKTDNILFICAGAFNGLHKMILDRISKGSIGFGATVRAAPGSSSNSGNQHETVLEGEEELFEKYLPYYQAAPEPARQRGNTKPKSRKFNTLDLVEPQDLQKFGLIPELVGRIPLSCALSSLDIEALVKVLTEPRNSLLQQYKQLFTLSSIELRITSSALRVIAGTASKMGTGARGLKTVMERLLGDAMFETPGSSVKYVLITEAVAERKSGVLYFYRGEAGRFAEVWGREEEVWEDKLRRAEEEEGGSDFERRAENNSVGGAARTFEEYREKATAGGFV
ncbi:ATP-binding protein [Friedmanniomyces endolithicus]|uniref:ATP-binding protein n=1 Tax=Friedmanniomyces endolithicus TaxID=329885 RepID=A0AAN6FF56_9PEZI|nr:ATP-binding protein [Friedmanniomyces endolithicus]KAK0270915.1 ATP-binding protein [Friedmanniomyces endolithicus]KAK0317141.1 ATP-binding protein [Friedmanniomyces endolithicus]KAK1015429.1 ATP-binding protein [Friedmanniomyces endolithicus]